MKDNGLTVLTQYPFMFKEVKVNYLTSNLPASSFETDRKQFLGENEYGTFRSPLSLFGAELSNTEANRGDNIAALLTPLGVLQPGETRRLITQLGQETSYEAARAGIDKFRNPEAVDIALTDISKYWDGYLSAFQVQTPDAAMNAMLNIHNPHQCYITKNWSRYLSYYQLGLGARGIGIRDSSQDILGVLASIPDEGKAFLKILLTFQRRIGSAFHQFNPMTMEGSEGDSLEMEDRYHYYSDDHLWGALAVTAYIKETGDFGFLDEVLPFYDKDKQGNPIESVSVLEHLKRGLAFTRSDVGAHGLPLLGFADWNDTINLPKGAESLFTTHLYGKVLSEVIALMDALGDKKSADDLHVAYQEMKTRFEQVAWDGEWYVMYFDQAGSPIGSHKNEKGQIHLNGQSWAVLSGFASPERARQAMQSVNERLNTKFGIKLSTPGYNGFDPKYGGVTTYPPGAKENGGIFLHPNPWAMIAEAMLGNGERAFEYYAQINPAGKNDLIDVYESEPYVYPQNILGDEHPQFGLARNAWLSGTSSWCYQAGTQWIIGIRVEYDGLRIDPCIPSSWDGFSAVRKFRGSTIRIKVHNPEHVCKGVAKMAIDGKQVEGNLVPVSILGNNHDVEVWLGKMNA
jgi:cellobiose phosphorylase